jgi:hypothetical protein
MRGGELREFDMRLAPRRDVHRVGLFACKHRRGISINTGNRERRGARVFAPRGEMILGNIAGADKTYAQPAARRARRLNRRGLRHANRCASMRLRGRRTCQGWSALM